MFEYFRAMRTTKSHLRYFDYLSNVLDAWGKTGGQQGDPLEVIIFCLSVHHLWAALSTSTTKTHALWRTPLWWDLADCYPQLQAFGKEERESACVWLHQSQAVRRPRGALGHEAGTQGRRWPRPQFRQDAEFEDQVSRQGYLGGTLPLSAWSMLISP